MSVSPFQRKAVLCLSLMVFALLFVVENTHALPAGNNALGSGVINAPSVRMKVNKVFLPLDDSEGANAKQENKSSKQGPKAQVPPKAQAQPKAKKVTGPDSGGVKNGKASANRGAAKNIAGKKTPEQKKAQQPAKKVTPVKNAKKPKPAPKGKDVRSKSADRKVAHDRKKIRKAAAGQVRGLNFNAGGKAFKAEVLLSKPADKVSWFSLKKPERLVVDLRGSWEGRVRSKHKLKNGPVKTVVVGEHSDRFRFVFYMKKGVSAAGLKPQIKKMPKKLGISFNINR
ncbi:AMIN domain-containing protein [Maridesulfovibrio bastinii]|uniref:AMIN domain-containing protein n=1 Tax=Maridesulfovibrio bastinii TaxID=47157 RepID=UPI000404A6F6|nr:AMIN domain-containing protein [Maridesulfovibrio bastinii]